MMDATTTVHAPGWAFCSNEQTTRVHRYTIDDQHVQHTHAEQRLYIMPPSRADLNNVRRWCINDRYTIDMDLVSALLTFRWDGRTTTDPLFWCTVDGQDAVECSLYMDGVTAGEPAHVQAWDEEGHLVIDTHWTPSSPPRSDLDEGAGLLNGEVVWEGSRTVLNVQASKPFSLTVQTVEQGRFDERTTEHLAGTHRFTFQDWFADYVGLCLSCEDVEDKHILVGRFGSGSGRWLFDPRDGTWVAPPEGSLYRHRSAAVRWDAHATWESLGVERWSPPEGIQGMEWWVHEDRLDDVALLRAWSAQAGVSCRVQTYGPSGRADWWSMDPLSSDDVQRFLSEPSQRVMMVPFEDATTVSWERVRAASLLAQQRSDHRIFEWGWWAGDGAAWSPWLSDEHHRVVGEASHGVGFMRSAPADACALLRERKRDLPRQPCQVCLERPTCAQRVPFPLPSVAWSTCGGWDQGPLMGHL